MTALTALSVGGISASAASSHAAGAPAGNNGTVKIDEFVMDGGKGNDPHVGCGFSVTFYG